MASLPAFPELRALGPAWGRALLAVAKQLRVSADELAATVWLESRGRASAVSPGGKRGGLFQWSDATARASGAPSLVELLREDATAQLRYVEGYLRPFARRCARPGDVRLAVFASAGLGMPDDHVLPLSPSTVAQNRGLDPDGSGTITCGEVRAQCLGALAGRGRWQVPEHDDGPGEVSGLGLLLLLGGGVVLARGLT